MSNKKNILVTGANGQLGMELRALEKKYPAFDLTFVTREELPITNTEIVAAFFSQYSFTHCINCAAYTAVDKAESEPALAFKTNAAAAGNLAVVCKKNNTQFIHISTDYVFDGNGTVPYKETDPTDPQGVYAASKLDGEKEVIRNNDQSIIIRTSWVYSSYGKNFVKTMLRLMNEKESIGVVNDQVGSPTYAADLAAAILEIISLNKENTAGIYHYCNEGIISWYDLATAIKQLINSKCIVNPIPTSAYPTPAKRPKYSVLDTTKIRDTFGVNIPLWRDSLEKCIGLLSEQL
ncbi:MAG: dTDP-4-dehydrorhamnose reductase [Ferruginibacter sp.]